MPYIVYCWDLSAVLAPILFKVFQIKSADTFFGVKALTQVTLGILKHLKVGMPNGQIVGKTCPHIKLGQKSKTTCQICKN